MDVQLSDGDRIVVEYHGVADEDGAGPNQVVVAYENGSSEVYMVMWRGSDLDPYNIMWRADFRGCMKVFAEFIDDLEVEAQKNYHPV